MRLGLEQFGAMHLSGRLPPELTARIWTALKFLEKKGYVPEGTAEAVVVEGVGAKSTFLRYIVKCWLEAVESMMLEEGERSEDSVSERGGSADSEVETPELGGGEDREVHHDTAESGGSDEEVSGGGAEKETEEYAEV